MTVAEMEAKVAQLEAENARLQALAAKRGPKVSSMRVSDKGALSVYGLQRFPVTLYKAQWMALLTAAPEIAAYIKANSHLLTDKQADA